MTIILTKDGDQTTRLERSTFVDEAKLQEYIHKNPESIPVDEIETGLNLLILAREFPTNSGPIDALGVDQKGNLYIIETKLFANADKRRVLAQVLDYGAALWKHGNDYNEFLRQLDEHTIKNFKQSVNDKVAEFYSLDEEAVALLLANLESSLTAGRFRFMVLMDTIDDRLKDLILYVNQNSAFDVFAVELEYYQHENQQIIIPRLYGAEVKKDVGKVRTEKRRWDWESFRDERLAEFGQPTISATEAIITWSNKNNIEIFWTDSQRGGFIMCFYTTDGKGFYPFNVSGEGRIGWNAPHQGDKSPAPFNDPELRKEIMRKVAVIQGAEVDIENVDGYKGLRIPLDALSDVESQTQFFSVCSWIQDTLQSKNS